MNINKTNPLGVMLIEKRFSPLKGTIDSIITEEKARQNDPNYVSPSKGAIMIPTRVFEYNGNFKVLRLTKNVIRNAKLINVDAIKEHLNVGDFDFDSIAILLDNDVSGIIKIVRSGSDFEFVYMKDIQNNFNLIFDAYSFLTQDFNFEDHTEGEDVSEDKLFVVQILAYLYYGDITTKIVKSKTTVKLSSFTKFLNNSPFPVTYVDSLWKQRISVDGFTVRGHFRMQPYGEGRNKRKLIWIEEFGKEGYNRRATREITQDKK